jgi:hypothetical protein
LLYLHIARLPPRPANQGPREEEDDDEEEEEEGDSDV